MGRKSPEERRKEKLIASQLKRVDKKGRTRSGKSLQKKVANEDFARMMMEDAQRQPPRSCNGKNIYSGKWRGFEQSFATKWWNEQKQPWVCHLCRTVIDPNGTHGAAPSIDHKKPWSDIMGETDTTTVCYNGVHWEVAFTEDIRSGLQDERNLAPAHQDCNSSKNGTKGNDSLAPQKRGMCIYDGMCPLPKGSP